MKINFISSRDYRMDAIKRILKFIAKPITNLEDAWNNQTPRGQFLLFYKIFEFIARTCLQMHCIFGNEPIGPRGYVPGFFCFSHVFLLVYTTFFYAKTGNFIECLPSYCMLGVAIAVSYDFSESFLGSFSFKPNK